MKPKKDVRWNPRRRGEIYCSPACGGRCTWSEYQTAHKVGAELAKSLGKGWTINVFENLGWHVAVEKGACSISIHLAPKKRTTYTVYFNTVRQVVTDGDDVDEALRLALSIVRRQANQMLKDWSIVSFSPR